MTARITTDVVSRLADLEGVEPTDLDFALADYIEPQALEAVVSHHSEQCELTFEVPGYRITVFGSGEFTIESLEESEPADQPDRDDRLGSERSELIASRIGQLDLTPPVVGRFEGLPDLCFIYDRDGIHRDVMTKLNRTDLLRGDPDALIGQPIHDVLPDEVAETILAQIRTALREDQTRSFPVEFDVPAGTRTFSCHVHPLPAEDGEHMALMTVWDTTVQLAGRPQTTK